MKFSEKLSNLRKEKKLSQEQLADMLNVSRQSVSKWESGQTYPEMDKLLSICKIFDCGLNELTNDEVNEVKKQTNEETKSNNYNMQNIINDFLEMINKSVSMFKNMTFKKVCIFILEFIIILIIMRILKIPFDLVYELPSRIFDSINNVGLDAILGLLKFFIEAAYIVFSFIAVIYFYKVRYLDKFDDSQIKKEKVVEKVDKKDEEQAGETKQVERKAAENEKKQYSFPIFGFLGKLFVYFIKFIAIMFLIPFIVLEVAIALSLSLVIILTTKGIIFIGAIIMIVCALCMDGQIMEVITNFIGDKKQPLTKIFIVCFISLLGFGAGLGITVLEISNYQFINEVPKYAEQTIVKKEIDMNQELVFIQRFSYRGHEMYVEDNTMGDKVRIEVMYYNNNQKVEIDVSNDNIVLVSCFENDGSFFKQDLDRLINDLSQKTVYNYLKMYDYKVTVSASKQNIDKLLKNSSKRQEQERKEEEKSQVLFWKSEVEQLEQQLYNLQQENSQHQEQVTKYEQEINEYKNKIEQYEDHINRLNSIVSGGQI